MIIVRDVFHCKYGMGDQVVEMMKRMYDGSMGPNDAVKSARLMTDLSGRYFTVISELEMESIDAHQKLLHEAFASADFPEEFGRMTSLIESGHREYYTIESDYRGQK